MSQQPQSSSSQLLSLPGLDESEDTSLVGPAGPPWWRRRGTIIGIAVALLIILLGALFLVLMSRRPRTIYQFQQVTQGNLSITIGATGPVQGGIYNINFSGSGKITEIDVQVGQTVTQGQIVAKLDKTSLQDAVNQAKAAVSAAQTTLNNAQNNSGATATQSNANISAAQTALNNAQTNLSKAQAQSSASVSAAQTALNNANTNLSKAQAQSAVSINAAQTALNNAQTNLSNVQAQSAASVQVAKDQMTQACTPATTPPTAACTTATDQYNQAVATANANIATAQGQVNTAQSNLSTAQAQADANNAAAQAQVNTAQSNLSTAQAQADANNAAAQASVNSDQKALNTARANAGVSNTSGQGTTNSAESSLQTALVQLQTAEHNLDNATLRAPHGGIVTVINGTIGGTPGVPANASTSTTGTSGTFVQIVDASALQVIASVNETDTANLKVGDPAQFTVNAYGTRQFTGTVSAISPNGQTVSNVVTYPVYINVDINDLFGANLLPGMTANVTITVLQRSNVLLIPVDAVNFARLASTSNPATGTTQLISQQQVNAAMQQARQMLQQLQNQNPNIAAESPIPAFVLERSGNQFVVKPVVLGLTDGTVYEVLSGLNAGENVIVGTTTRSASTPGSSSPGGRPGGGGPFGFQGDRQGRPYI